LLSNSRWTLSNFGVKPDFLVKYLKQVLSWYHFQTSLNWLQCFLEISFLKSNTSLIFGYNHFSCLKIEENQIISWQAFFSPYNHKPRLKFQRNGLDICSNWTYKHEGALDVMLPARLGNLTGCIQSFYLSCSSAPPSPWRRRDPRQPFEKKERAPFFI
jgi:hypothetical protein